MAIKKRIAIFGASGNVGKHCARELIREIIKRHVRPIDSKSVGNVQSCTAMSEQGDTIAFANAEDR